MADNIHMHERTGRTFFGTLLGAWAHLWHGVGDRGMSLHGVLGGCCQHVEALAKEHTDEWDCTHTQLPGVVDCRADAHRHSSCFVPLLPGGTAARANNAGHVLDDSQEMHTNACAYTRQTPPKIACTQRPIPCLLTLLLQPGANAGHPCSHSTSNSNTLSTTLQSGRSMLTSADADAAHSHP